MRMQEMVEYLEAKGFKATKKYIPEARHYEFRIEKDGNRLMECFKYPENCSELEKNLKQESFLDHMLDDFRRLFRHSGEWNELPKELLGMFAPSTRFTIKQVIFNDPATIVLWTDGTKTVVKAENEPFDPEKGLAMAISKKALGNKGNYYNVFTKWLPEEKPNLTPNLKPNLKLNYIPNTERLSIGMNKAVKAWDDFCSKLGDELNHD